MIIIGNNNKNNSEEITLDFDGPFDPGGWVDTFREFNKDPHQYSWWSQRFPSVRLNNKGWRNHI